MFIWCLILFVYFGSLHTLSVMDPVVCILGFAGYSFYVIAILCPSHLIQVWCSSSCGQYLTSKCGHVAGRPADPYCPDAFCTFKLINFSLVPSRVSYFFSHFSTWNSILDLEYSCNYGTYLNISPNIEVNSCNWVNTETWLWETQQLGMERNCRCQGQF